MEASEQLEQVGPSPNGAPPTEEWRRDKEGKEYTPRREGRGIIYRQGEETLQQALERDAQPRGPRPKRRKPKQPLPEPPKGVDLKLLEEELRQALKAPGAICAAAGEEWPAEHFELAAPRLARNLVLAAEHNPWLRRQLEEIASGQQALGKVISLMSVAGAAFFYAVPPAIYFLNIKVPPVTRKLFGDIPERTPRLPDAPYPAPAPPAFAT